MPFGSSRRTPIGLARDIRGIGFRTADQIAAKLGIEKTALIRVRAGISYALAEAMDEGHCGLPVEELVPSPKELLEVPAELVETALSLELEDGAVVADDLEGRRCVFLAAFTEPSAKSPRSSRRSPPESRPGRRLTSTRPSRGSSRGRSWRLPTARKRGAPGRTRLQCDGHHRRARRWARPRWSTHC